MRELKTLPLPGTNQTVVLIAEDESMVQELARITLEREGYLVLTADDGEEALVLSRHHAGQIQILLSDVIMPKMSGVELSDRVSTEQPAIHILLMTGHADEIQPRFPCLLKPFTPRQLTETIRGLL